MVREGWDPAAGVVERLDTKAADAPRRGVSAFQARQHFLLFRQAAHMGWYPEGAHRNDGPDYFWRKPKPLWASRLRSTDAIRTVSTLKRDAREMTTHRAARAVCRVSVKQGSSGPRRDRIVAAFIDRGPAIAQSASSRNSRNDAAPTKSADELFRGDDRNIRARAIPYSESRGECTVSSSRF